MVLQQLNSTTLNFTLYQEKSYENTGLDFELACADLDQQSIQLSIEMTEMVEEETTTEIETTTTEIVHLLTKEEQRQNQINVSHLVCSLKLV